MTVPEFQIAAKATESWPRFKIFSLTTGADNSKLSTPMLRRHLLRVWPRWRQASTEKCAILQLLWKTPGAMESEQEVQGSSSMNHKTGKVLTGAAEFE